MLPHLIFMAAPVLPSKDVWNVLDTQHKRIIDDVRKRDHKVIEVPYDEVSIWGGGFLGRGITVHYRHLHVHQNQVIVPGNGFVESDPAQHLQRR